MFLCLLIKYECQWEIKCIKDFQCLLLIIKFSFTDLLKKQTKKRYFYELKDFRKKIFFFGDIFYFGLKNIFQEEFLLFDFVFNNFFLRVFLDFFQFYEKHLPLSEK